MTLKIFLDVVFSAACAYLLVSVPFVWRRIRLTSIERRARDAALERRSPSDYVAHEGRIQQLDDAPLFRWTP